MASGWDSTSAVDVDILLVNVTCFYTRQTAVLFCETCYLQGLLQAVPSIPSFLKLGFVLSHIEVLSVVR